MSAVANTSTHTDTYTLTYAHLYTYPEKHIYTYMLAHIHARARIYAHKGISQHNLRLHSRHYAYTRIPFICKDYRHAHCENVPYTNGQHEDSRFKIEMKERVDIHFTF